MTATLEWGLHHYSRCGRGSYVGSVILWLQYAYPYNAPTMCAEYSRWPGHEMAVRIRARFRVPLQFGLG